MKKTLYYLASFIATGTLLASCSQDGPDDKKDSDNNLNTAGIAIDNGTIPAFSQEIPQWNGRKATDADLDAVGNDNDIYHELNTFTKKVTVEFNGNTATVTSTYPTIQHNIQGAYVTVDFLTPDLSGVEIIAKGSTTDGGLKIYGAGKFKLTLDGVAIESKLGPAINSQCKKRVFVNLVDGTTNTLTDAATYSADPFYVGTGTVYNEDRKGCFFAEGDMIVSGTGTLEVRGKNKHGIAVDGYMVTRPGSTIAVTQAAKNCIQLKGDETDQIGLWVKGGYLYALTDAPAGKAIKTDQNIRIDGGILELNTTGDAIYESDVDDTSSSACLKADTYISITAGDVALRSTGKGGKGINASTTVTLAGGNVGVSCTGTKYVYSETMTASAKAIKADQSISLTGGELTVLSTGNSDGCRGIESDTEINLSGSDVTVYAYDDALNSPTVSVSGNSVLNAFSVDDDGIRAKETFTMTGGNVTAVGGSSPAGGINCNSSAGFNVSGGTLIVMGGNLSNGPGSVSLGHRTWIGLTADKGTEISVSSATQSLMTFTMPRTIEGGTILIASQALPSSGALSLKKSNGTQCAPDSNR